MESIVGQAGPVLPSVNLITGKDIMLPKKSAVSLLFALMCFGCLTGMAHAQDDAKSAKKKKRPNILFIAVDDLRPELGCYGVKEIKTPNLDRLAERGVLFNRAYCQQAVCNPSRASLMTGLRPDSTKVWDLITPLRSRLPDAVTLPQYFKQNGYYTVGMGKIFHNTFPDPPSWTEPEQPKPKGPIRMWSPEVIKALKQWRAEAIKTGKSERFVKHIRGTATDCEDVPDNVRIDGALGDLALEQLRKAHDQSLPFFLAVGFIQPHLPFTPPKKYWDLYDPQNIPPATNDFLPRGMPPLAFGDRSHGGMYELMYHLDFKDAPGPFEGNLTEAQRRRLKHGYYAAVSFIDAQVGRILDELDRLGLADDTIIVLWGDHGWKLGEHHGWCKQTNYEIDTRVPLMIVMPGAKGNGQKTNALVEFVDIYPTLCELAGLPVPENLEGDSLSPLLKKPEGSVKPMAISQFRRRHRDEDYMGYAMRTDRYRYIEWILRRTGKTTCIEIYDHQNDPEENENIAAKPGQEALAKELSDMLWKKIPRPKPFLPSAQQTKPNVLFIAVDDLRPELGCYGNREIKSPNIDRLATSGVTFTRAYCQSAACNQSRASLMTGLRPDTIRVWDLFTEFRRNRPDVVTLPQAFKRHGYHTAAIGKIYHNNIPDDASWSEPKLHVPGYPFDPDAVYRKKENIERLAERRKEIMAAGTQDKYLDRFGEWYLKTASTECIDVPDDAYFDGAQTTMALEKLAELKRRGGPFFLGVGYYRPHLPFNAPKKYWDLYDREKIPLAENDFLPKNAPPMAINNMAELRRSYEDFHGNPPARGRPLNRIPNAAAAPRLLRLGQLHRRPDRPTAGRTGAAGPGRQYDCRSLGRSRLEARRAPKLVQDDEL